MNKLWSLTKIQLKNYWSKTMQNMGSGKRKGLMSLALIWLVFVFGMMAFQMANTIYDVTAQMGIPELSFALPYIMVSLGVMVLSITALINLFYYSDSTGFLLTLPIKENSIILSKLAVQYIFSFFMTALFIFPTLFVYFSKAGFNLVGFIGGLVAVVTMPIVPLLIASIIVVLLMKTVGRSINRRAMSVVISILVMILVFSFNIIVSRSAQSNDFLLNILNSQDGLLKYIGLQFPPVVWATKMIAGSLLHLGLFIVLNLGLIVLFNIIAQPLVKTTLRNFNQAESKVIVKKASYQGRSQIGALVRRNIQIIYKTPAFLMNTLMLLLFPFIMVAITSLSNPDSAKGIAMLLDSLGSSSAAPYRPVILTIAFIAPVLMGALSATAITREGKYLWQVKIMPISAKNDINARIISCAVLIGAAILVILGFAVYFLPITIIDIVWSLLIAIPAVYGMLAIDMCIDIARPILTWSNPTHAMKNNMNILAALAWKALLGVVVFIAVKAIVSVAGIYALTYSLLAMALILGGLGFMLLNNAVKKYNKLEIK